ncbi:ubiquitin-like-specific protease ESD4 isoform X1 [Rhododendron vialii]|uniref:ubiquitin-like-specific protease ESD4 isoform X1 n=1 Tax=Rhododendron vialii TaxID=182163 RepID=UPI00265DE0C3|nr:ubiquitin-like-specific protease ESD4 isoform X1 [Rhododendron vialii]
MGALTTNRKRRDEYYTLDYKLPSSYYTPNDDNQIDLHVSKKPRFQPPSYPIAETRVSSKSAETRVSRVFRYPEPVNRIGREVHAPCRFPKLGFLAGSNRSNSRPSGEEFGDVIGSIPRFGYNWGKNRALEAVRYFQKDKEVVHIDVDVENYEDDALEDSSIEKDEWAKNHAMKNFVYRKKDKEVMDVDVEDYGNDALKGSSIGKVDWAKNHAVESFGYRKTDKEVVDVEEEKCRSNVSTGSSIEEVEFMEDEVVPSLQGLDGKVVERNFRPSSSSVVSELTKVDNNAAISLEQKLEKLELLGLPMYKKLLQNVERRKPKLDSLSFEIELNETRRATLQLLRPVKRVEEEDVLQDALREPFLPLTKEEEAEVSRALSNSYRRRVLVTHENSNIEITGELLQCLRPGAWLNDEVINIYLELLKEREKRQPKNFLKCHFFNTFFYKKLFSGRKSYDFKSVRRWTTQRKLGYCLRECDKIFIPIHKEVHWCLAVINLKDQKFQYLDSLGCFDTQVLKVLAMYFVDEVKDKSGDHIDTSSWKQEFVEDLPEQENGWDCGVFMIKYADFYSRGLGLHFNQEHMPYFRLRTAKEILRLKAE